MTIFIAPTIESAPIVFISQHNPGIKGVQTNPINTQFSYQAVTALTAGWYMRTKSAPFYQDQINGKLNGGSTGCWRNHVNSISVLHLALTSNNYFKNSAFAVHIIAK